MTDAERARKCYHENEAYRERKKGQVRAYALRHRERLRARRHVPEFRAKRARYERVRRLVARIIEERSFALWQESRGAA